MNAVVGAALTCRACGAPFDVGAARGDRVACPACGGEDSLAAHGLTRVRRFRVVPPDPSAAEAALRQSASESGIVLSRVETHPTTQVFFGRGGRIEGLLYRTRLGQRQAMDSNLIEDFIVWDLSGYVVAPQDHGAPVAWLTLSDPNALLPYGDVLLTHLDVSLRNFEASVRESVGADLDRAGRAADWCVDRVDVTVQTWGEPFLAELPFVWLTYQVAPPHFGRVLEPPPTADGYTVCYLFDGRLVAGQVPRALMCRAGWLALGAAVLLLLLLLVGGVFGLGALMAAMGA
ncbi:MAG: zinc ribbon domain-containing protein [Polyangiaceae bacterium]|nr:zinc ribbon domain-containing protein [Polyangiaceae bacterium]